MKSFSCVQLLATSWTAAYQVPPSMGFSRQEYWSGVPLPSPTTTTTCISKFLGIMEMEDTTISYNGCIAQLFFSLLLGAFEFYLLATMSHDCYVAICKPLNYTAFMNSKICTLLVFCCWIAGFFIIFIPLLLTLNLAFFASNIVDHFMCDPTTFLQISCSDTQLTETMGFISALMTLVVPLSMVFTSCTYIALIILKIPSTNERKKAFSTCSHMIVIFFSNGSCILMYVKPSVKENVFKRE